LWHPRSAWASPSPQLLPNSSSLLGERGCTGNGASRLWGARLSPCAVWDNPLASAELLCSRLLGLGLSALGQGLGTTGYAAAQGWHHAEFEGISLGHLADLERMLQRTVDGQPARPDGAATGWLQGFPTVAWQAALQKGALGFWRRGSIWWLVARSGPPNSWKAFVRRRCTSHVTLLHLHWQLAWRNQRSCQGAYGPWLISQCRSAAQATSAAAGPPHPVPGWVGMARVVLLRVCPSLQTLLCATFCAPEAVVSGLLPVARDQHARPSWCPAAHATCH
jgi:hypothetical protein